MKKIGEEVKKRERGFAGERIYRLKLKVKR
jgi:hypothetical protein